MFDTVTLLPCSRIALVLGTALATVAGAQAEPPPVQREMRALWVASVSNIDWPSKPGLSAWQQKHELIAILDRAASLNFNAIILQVRPAADALYASQYEPWSEYLTGKMGLPPSPYYDPLEFAVTEAHRRGLQLHAWFNPYRARHPSAKSEISRSHVSRARPQMVRRYGAHLWMDPGDAAVQTHTVNVILDVVKRYNVDGIHLDDYFYPYKERDASKELIDFPDRETFARYVAGGGKLARNDWRRANVDSLVRRLYREIKLANPRVQFGVSPFGIWRPGNPASIRGFDAYNEIYADSRTWLNRGWLDYFTPQLYWHTRRTEQSYPVLLAWWVSQNMHRRHIWPGNFTSRVGTSNPDPWNAAELLYQIELTRRQFGAGGNVHFSAKALTLNRDSLAEKLLGGPYANPAVIPASPWLDSIPPAPPVVGITPASDFGGLMLNLRRGNEQPWLWTVRTLRKGQWTTAVLPGWIESHPLHDGTTTMPAAVVVNAVDRSGNLSLPVSLASPFSAVPRN